MKMIVLYGPPAVGKLTVARELARLTGIKLFHNYLTWNAVISVFDWRSEPFARALPEIRRAIFREAARAGINLAFTFVYSLSAGHLAERYFETVEMHGGEVCLVRLTAPQTVLEQHVTSKSRLEVGKMATVEALHRYLELKPDVGQAIPTARASSSTLQR